MTKSISLPYISKLGPDVRDAMRVLDAMALNPVLKGDILKALVGAFVRGGFGPFALDWFESPLRDSEGETTYNPTLAALIKNEMKRDMRVNHLLVEEPIGGWRILPGVEGDEETRFRIQYPGK